MEQPKRVALVTGAARRVGQAVVLRLAESGFDVAFTYNTRRREADQLVQSLQGKGTNALAIQADLLQPDNAASHVYQEFSRQFSRLDVLVNNASLYEPSPLQSVSLEQTRKFWAIHVEAPLMLCQKLESLLRSSRGHVINMVDLLAKRPTPTHLAYCASKAALANLTLSLARELAPEVTVNGIAPGVVQWPEAMPQEQREQYLKRVPLGRAGTPEDVAALVHFLCTEGAYITGQIVPLDGGKSIM